MGYFDSTKNRALWEIELQNLRKLRAERAAGKHVTAEPAVTRALSGKAPVRMTYQDLLREEAASQSDDLFSGSYAMQPLPLTGPDRSFGPALFRIRLWLLQVLP